MLVVKQYITNLTVLVLALLFVFAVESRIGLLSFGMALAVALFVYLVVALVRSPWKVVYKTDGVNLVVRRVYLNGTREYKVPISSITALWEGLDMHRRAWQARRLYAVMGDKAVFIGKYRKNRRVWLEENLGKSVEESGHVVFMVKGIGMQIGKTGVIAMRDTMSYKQVKQKAWDLKNKQDLTE